jgi:ketosteroid isomerase-like protein
MTDTTEPLGETLAHMQQVVTSFCRGVDRHDADILASCYTPDATENHGIYAGSAAGFVDWVVGFLAQAGFMQHAVSNLHLLGMSGDTATTETYYHVRCAGLDGELAHVFGRYLDTWRRHDGRWLIADRLCILDWSSPNSGYSAADFENGATDRTDPSYRFSQLVG